MHSDYASAALAKADRDCAVAPGVGAQDKLVAVLEKGARFPASQRQRLLPVVTQFRETAVAR